MYTDFLEKFYQENVIFEWEINFIWAKLSDGQQKNVFFIIFVDADKEIIFVQSTVSDFR